MTTSAQSIIYQAQRALLDKEGVRASASDLVKLLNMAQRDIQIARPDTTAAVSQVALVAGPRQTLPDVASVLIDIPANASGLRSRITKVDLGLLDALERNWRSKTAGETVHFTHDPITPRQYHVYPPATAGALVDMEYSAYPVDIPEPAAPGLESSTVAGDISLTDQWANTLLMVTLYYAYMTDLEGINNIALASGYLQRSEAMLGVQLQASMTVSKPK